MKHDHDLKCMSFKVAGSWLGQILDREYARWGKIRSPGEERLLEHIATLSSDLCQGIIAPLKNVSETEQEDSELPADFSETNEYKKIMSLLAVADQHIAELRTVTSNKSLKDLDQIIKAVRLILVESGIDRSEEILEKTLERVTELEEENIVW